MELLNKHDCLNVLYEKFKTKRIEFITSVLEPFSDEPEGFLGEHYKLTIVYKTNETEQTENFFIKTKPKNEAQSEVIKFYHAYEKETFLYDFVMKEFEKNKFNTGFTPKSYYCLDNTTIVMENMIDKNYKTIQDYFDVPHCKTAMKSLAYFHANSIAYEEIKSTQLGKKYRLIDENPEIFIELFSEKDNSADKFILSIVDCLKIICEQIDETDEWKRNCYKKINNLDPIKLFFDDYPTRQTLTHGDLWSNNMLFKYEDDTPTHCVLVDFQLMRYHHPAYDAFALIHQNTRRLFRKHHLDELILYYYECFRDVLKENGFDSDRILPWDDFFKTGKALEPIAILQAFSSKTLTLLPKHVMLNATKSKEDMNKLWFTDRAKYVSDFLKSDDKYKEIVEEFLYEFYEYF